MNWFTRLCRQTGFLVHQVVKPASPPDAQTRQVSRKVEEKQVSPTVTLRRTTIEEVEIKHPGSSKDQD